MAVGREHFPSAGPLVLLGCVWSERSWLKVVPCKKAAGPFCLQPACLGNLSIEAQH